MGPLGQSSPEAIVSSAQRYIAAHLGLKMAARMVRKGKKQRQLTEGMRLFGFSVQMSSCRDGSCDGACCFSHNDRDRCEEAEHGE